MSNPVLIKNILLLIVIAILNHHTIAQNNNERKSFIKGLSIEAGAGYGILMHRYYSAAPVQEYMRSAFWVQPTARVSYNIPILQSSPDRVFITPFIGYYIFGGRTPEMSNGYKDEFIFKSLEGGLLIPVFLFNNISFSPAIKAQYIFESEQKFYGTLYQPDSIPRKWNIEHLNIFKNYAMNAGLNIKYHIRKFTFALEAWYGFTNLNALTIPQGSGHLKVNEHNVRFLAGYVF